MNKSMPILLLTSTMLMGCLAVENQVLGEEAVAANHEMTTRSYMNLDCNSLLLQRQSLAAVKRPGMLLVHPGVRAHGQKQLAAAEEAIKRKKCAS